MSQSKFGADAFQTKEEDLYKYEVPHVKTKEPLGVMVMRGFNQPVLERYRELRNGNGRAKGDSTRAREYLFKRTFVRFEFYSADGETPALDLGECKDEMEFFLTNVAMVVDAVVIQHLAAVFPDIDEKK